MCTLLLHPESIRGLRVEICCIFVLFGTAAEETEAATCTLQCLVCLRSELLAVDYGGEDAKGRVGKGMMRDLLSVAELGDLGPF